MADFLARKPLAGRRNGGAAATFNAYGLELRERPDLGALLVTCRDLADVEGAIRLSPSEWLIVQEGSGRGASRLEKLVEGRTALVQDMSSAFAFLEAAGSGILGVIGASTLARREEGAFTTRLADLRVTLTYSHDPERALLIVDRFSADYLWEWLIAKLSTGGSTADVPARHDGCAALRQGD